MTLYLVLDPGQQNKAVWPAWKDKGLLYSYLANDGAWYLNRGLSLDLVEDQEMTYQPVDVATAQKIIDEGVISRTTHQSVIDILRQEPARSTSEVLESESRGSG